MKVYIATRMRHAVWAEQLAELLTAFGSHEVVSSWHRGAMAPMDDGALSPEEDSRLHAVNIAELRAADVVVVRATEDGGEHLCEAGAAYVLGKRIVWMGREVMTARQPGVVRVGSVAEAIDAVGRV